MRDPDIDTTIREGPSQEDIARLAYEFYTMRGREEGRDVDDWLTAERQLAELYHDYQEYG